MSVRIDYPPTPADRQRLLTWLREAWSMLQRDARSWWQGSDPMPPTVSLIDSGAGAAQRFTVDTPAADVQANAQAYGSLRAALMLDGVAEMTNPLDSSEPNLAIRSAPPIDAAIPWAITETQWSEAPLPPNVSWGTAYAQAHRIYPAGDLTRRAVDTWAEQFRTAQALDGIATRRFRRLLSDVLARMRLDDEDNLGTTGPTPPMPPDAGGLPPVSPRPVAPSAARAVPRETMAGAAVRGGLTGERPPPPAPVRAVVPPPRRAGSSGLFLFLGLAALAAKGRKGRG